MTTPPDGQGRAAASPGWDATSETVEIKVRENGPYKVTGPVRVVDADGRALPHAPGEPIVLCRCGRSATKPFCDGSHRSGFNARERAA